MIEHSKHQIGVNNFDFLRFLLATLVVFSHSFPLATGNENLEPLARFTSGQVTLGSLAVDCFFVISGYLISHSWNSRPEIWPFLRKRIRRIYPGFIAVALLDAFLISPLFSTSGFAAVPFNYVFEFAGQTARLLESSPVPTFQDNPAAGVINGSLWSISYEFWCYIGVVFCGILGLMRKPRVLLIATCLALIASMLFNWFHLTPGGGWIGKVLGYPPLWARLLPYFLVGMSFYVLRTKVNLTARGALICALLFACASQIPYGLVCLLPILAGYVIFWFAFLPLGRLSRFSRRGDYSYGIYLYSFPIMQVIVFYFGTPYMSPMTLFALGWPASVLAAVASWHLLESRFLRPKDRVAVLVPSLNAR